MPVAAPVAAPASASNVVEIDDMSDSDDEIMTLHQPHQAAALVPSASVFYEDLLADDPAPPPPQPAAAAPEPKQKLCKRKRLDLAEDASSTDTDWNPERVGADVLHGFREAKRMATLNLLLFDASSCSLFGGPTDDYCIIVKKRARGNSAGQTDVYVVLKKSAKRISAKNRLRSEVEIIKHFNAFPELNGCI